VPLDEGDEEPDINKDQNLKAVPLSNGGEDVVGLSADE
jgi:hypothetical protein